MDGLHSNYYTSLSSCPVVRLSGYETLHRLSGELYAYLNFGGATGTVKDALVHFMLSSAHEQGALAQGQPVVEASGGVFAVALAIACRVYKHPLYLVLPDTVSIEQIRYLQSLGAHTIDARARSQETLRRKASETAQKVNGYFIDYYNNECNTEFHRQITGPAIFKALEYKASVLVAGVGSGGTITGAGEYLKGWVGNIWTVAVQPAESQFLTGGMPAKHGLTGMGPHFVPGNYNPYVVDEIASVTSGEAKTAAAQLLASDGIAISTASGSVLCAAQQVLNRRPELGVVCILNGRSQL